ncbi:hypothetical protein [Deinococcus pimensis]|uniref:hypothetical protein n=1 Tax=Deinococcus pimensis TaxID=309888 RepID=UPI0004AE868B|nr:hypothetical protein [Deinococcus pimensis]
MSPEGRHSLAAWLVGLGLLAALVLALLSPLDWPLKLGAWVLLTLLLDESGNWFGYTGVLVGALPLLLGKDGHPVVPALSTLALPTTPEWSVVFPLVAAGLVALLLVKHTGTLVALILSVAVFVLPILLARRIGPSLDESVKLPGTSDFLTWALGAAIVGVVVALARRVLRNVRTRRERNTASA